MTGVVDAVATSSETLHTSPAQAALEHDAVQIDVRVLSSIGRLRQASIVP
jgi:hypothetical protein